MNIKTTTTFLFLLLINVSLFSQRIIDCDLKLRVNNETKYQINKLKLLGHEIDTILPFSKTEFFFVDEMYYSLGFDITFSRKPFIGKYEWCHMISTPIDYVGEKLIKAGEFELVLKIKKVKKDKYLIEFHRIEIKNEP